MKTPENASANVGWSKRFPFGRRMTYQANGSQKVRGNDYFGNFSVKFLAFRKECLQLSGKKCTISMLVLLSRQFLMRSSKTVFADKFESRFGSLLQKTLLKFEQPKSDASLFTVFLRRQTRFDTSIDIPQREKRYINYV
ncbi:MAG TPA: hypothetical protein VK400_08110, partial [Pyrinomonadaceae bacterium]|nr:hypothetical protein [Pyrinomonadaceae bacterium]